MDEDDIREMIRELRELSDSNDVELLPETRVLLRKAAQTLSDMLD